MFDHKKMLDQHLLSLLGSNEFVDKWWQSSNLHFRLRSPIEVYTEDEDGPEQVENYILSFCYGDYS